MADTTPTNSNHPTAGELSAQIRSLKLLVESELAQTRRGKLFFTILGTLSAASALVIPTLTWMMVSEHWLIRPDYPNIYTLLLSSTTFGAIAIGVGIALLRHSGKLGENYMKLRQRALRYEQMGIAITSSDLDQESIGLARFMTVLSLINVQLEGEQAGVGDAPENSMSKALMERAVIRFLQASNIFRGS